MNNANQLEETKEPAPDETARESQQSHRQSERVERMSENQSITQSELIQDEENIREPNAFVEQDPKPIFQKLAAYCQDKEMAYEYRKNAHRIRLLVPINKR